LVRKLEQVRQDKQSVFSKILGPDGKAQVTLDKDGVDSVVLSTQHSSDIDFEEFKQKIIDKIIKPIIPEFDNVYVNPAGPWHVGGFAADTGLTGRKITADNYGPQIPVGGGAFSGKDPSKVDRSAAYMARQLAVDYLRKFNARQVLVKLAYAIGKAEPVMATAIVDGKIVEITGYDLTPRGIIYKLNLTKPQFLQRARYGFFYKFN